MSKLFAGLLLMPIAGTAQAQIIDNAPPMREFTAMEVEAIPMPMLAFDPSAVDPDDFDKYFYFYRAETSFSVAYADILECDSLASGLNFYTNTSGALAAATAQYGVVGGALGGALGSAIADAIFGSAQRREMRRVNMRNCMFYKGYDRYGLEKDLWQEFHFEEGLSATEAEEREAKLLMQARVASAATPDQERLEP